MIRDLLLILISFLLLTSCVNHEHNTTVVLDSANDTTIINSTDSVMVIRIVVHDTIYIGNGRKYGLSKRAVITKTSVRDPFTEPMRRIE